MLTLDIEYSYYICQLSLTINKQLANLYYQYQEKNNVKPSDLDISDYQHENFLIRLIDVAEYRSDIDIALPNDSLILNYNRLTDLIEYMYNINNSIHIYRARLEETSITKSKLADIQLSDSRLSNLYVDNKNRICKLELQNVLLYNEIRKNKNETVDVGDVLLTFTGTEKVEMKGIISTECPEINTVYQWHIMKLSEELICFCILIFVGHQKFIIQITSNDIDVNVY